MALRGQMQQYNIKVMGVGGVGRMALIVRFVVDHFYEGYDPTAYDSWRKQCVIDDKVTMLTLESVLALEDATPFREMQIKDGEAFILVFSITSRFSFEQILNMRYEILRVKDKDSLPMILVGNKSDCELDRVVAKMDGEALAREMGCKYVETSAKLSLNVENAFFDIVRELRTYNGDNAPEPSQKVDEIVRSPGCFGRKCIIL